MPNPTLVVMAAGIGVRYGGVKQIVPVGPNGESIIHYSVYDALSAGFGKVVFIIRKDIEKAFRRSVGRYVEEHCETAYVFQQLIDVPNGITIPSDRQKPWGTAHAVFSSRNAVDEPFVVINADDFYGRTAFQTLCESLKVAHDGKGHYNYYMVGYRLENTLTEHGHVARGICTVNQEGYLLGIREHLRIQKFGERVISAENGKPAIDIPKDSMVSMNMWGFTPSLFHELETRFSHFFHEHQANINKAEYLLPDVVGDLLKEHKARVKVLPAHERWYGITYPQDSSKVRQAIRYLVQKGIYPIDLWESIQ